MTVRKGALVVMGRDRVAANRGMGEVLAKLHESRLWIHRVVEGDTCPALMLEAIMSTSEFDRLATEVGRDIVAQAAPQELPLYRSISQSYLEAPEQIQRKTVSKDEMLGFGVGVAVTYLTPTLLAVLSWVLKFLAEELKSSIHDQHLVGDILKKLFNKSGSAAAAKAAEVALTHEQLERIRKLAYDRARELKLKDEQASLLADSIIGRLAIST